MINLASLNSTDVIVFTLAGLLIIILLFGFILYFIFSYRHKQRDFILLNKEWKFLTNLNRPHPFPRVEVDNHSKPFIDLS